LGEDKINTLFLSERAKILFVEAVTLAGREPPAESYGRVVRPLKENAKVIYHIPSA
jgi:hypothetical protein